MAGLCGGPIILASGSAPRRAMLIAAGLDIIVDRPAFDEAAAKTACRQSVFDAALTAETLAWGKAASVQDRNPGRIVIAADQMLACGGAWFDKPADHAGAARQLVLLSGRTHGLFSAVVAMRDGNRLWSMVDSAELAMRQLSPDFIQAYIDAAGEGALDSVGGYQIEGLGIHLFARISGDHFTILGLPLLPLLEFLRSEGVVAT